MICRSKRFAYLGTRIATPQIPNAAIVLRFAEVLTHMSHSSARLDNAALRIAKHLRLAHRPSNARQIGAARRRQARYRAPDAQLSAPVQRVACVAFDAVGQRPDGRLASHEEGAQSQRTTDIGRKKM